VLLVPVAEQHARLGGIARGRLDELAGDVPKPARYPLLVGHLLHDGRAPGLRAAEDLVEQVLLPAEWR
jgi:hypothetical protein